MFNKQLFLLGAHVYITVPTYSKIETTYNFVILKAIVLAPCSAFGLDFLPISHLF